MLNDRNSVAVSSIATFDFFQRQAGQLGMGNTAVRLSADAKTLIVDDTKYKLTLGLLELITDKHPRAGQWKTNDYQVYKSNVAQTTVRSRIGQVLLDHTLYGNGSI